MQMKRDSCSRIARIVRETGAATENSHRQRRKSCIERSDDKREKEEAVYCCCSVGTR